MSDRLSEKQEIPTIVGRKKQKVDWGSPLFILTMGPLSIGLIGLCERLFPSNELAAYAVAIALLFGWRYAAHKAGLFPADYLSLERSRRSSFSVLQATADYFAFCVFMLCIFSVHSRIDSEMLTLVGITGIFAGLLGGWISWPDADAQKA